MADSKTEYTTNVNKLKQAAESNSELAMYLNNGKARADKYGPGWESVDINDVVEKFVPNATIRKSHGKIIYSNGGQFEVVADVAGGYLRIQDVTKSFEYVSMSGEYKPKDIGRSKWKQMTHYRIKKKEEM